MKELTNRQFEIINQPADAKIFLEGLAGAGKTTTSIERLLKLLDSGQSGNSTLVITPQRSLAIPYISALNSVRVPAGGLVTCLTMGGLAQRMISLFWPLIAGQAGFTNPDTPPIFLTLETAQYYMAYLVRPLLLEGYFESVIIDRNRLYSQILDNLGKASVVGFPYSEIGERLKESWTGDPGQLRVYDDTQECATLFRRFCLENNLLDYSLQIEVFVNHLWTLDNCHNYLTQTYRFLIIDNIEEDTPVSHDIIRNWISQCSSVMLIYDHNSGYRRFLGADPINAYNLKEDCDTHFELNTSFITSPEVNELNIHLANRLTHQKPLPITIDPRPALTHSTHRFFPEMLDWVTAEISDLIHKQNIAAGEIAVLSPYLSDALRLSIENRLEQSGISTWSHRPSRSLRDEPATQCLLTLAALAYPEWEISLTKFDVSYALIQAISGLDLIRAQLLTEIVFRNKEGKSTITSFDQITSDTQERITYLVGQRFDTLRNWIIDYSRNRHAELDHFYGSLFGEVLSQPGFGFHARYDYAEITANLIESIHKFRRVVANQLHRDGIPIGQEYYWMVKDGVIAAQYLRKWEAENENAVLLAPAYTFLMGNKPVSVQFWLDVNSRGWSERLNQPLTHPYVLSRQWNRNRKWTDIDEVEANQTALVNLTSGLLHRCRYKLYIGMSEFSEQGYEQRGPLLRAFQSILQRFSNEVS